MRWRVILPGVLVVVVASVGLATWRGSKPVPIPAPGPQPALPVLIANYQKADRIEVRYGSQLLWLERRGQVWGLSQAGGYPVQPEKAAALIHGLLELRLDHSVEGAPEGFGVADPTAPNGAGTLVRVLGVTGAVLGAIILGPTDGAPYVRRPGQVTTWVATKHVAASADPIAWTSGQIPAPGNVLTTQSDGLDDAAIRTALADLRFGDVRASAQLHPIAARSVSLALPDGTALLQVGRWDGRSWLQIAGSATWARQLAPYAFALGGGPLAVAP